MTFSSLSEPFIRRPVATSLMTVGIALAGAVAYRFLPVSPLPQVEFPTINVQAGLPGASPETMASSVATPLERQFGRIAGITEMTSSSGSGSTQVTLQFDLSRNIDAAARDVQAAINAARGQLPANLPGNPSYKKANPADAPIMLLALTSDTVERARMYDVASTILQQKLAELRGVGQVVVGGGALPAVRVELDPAAVYDSGLALEDVRTALAAANANRPKGDVGDDKRLWSVTTSDQLLKAAEYEPLVISAHGSAAVRLADIARVTDSVEDLHATGLANGKPAIILIIFRQPGANIIETVDRIRGVLPQLRASLPHGVELQVMIDATRTIRASVRDVEITLLIAIGLVVLVVFAFLRSARSTFIPSVAVPISLIGTFGVMYLLGYSIDNLSLMALTVATGFVVDDAIVVVENVTRHLEEGRTPLDAALIGAREIGFTVVSISLSLIAVFIPILFMGGIIGRLFREFAVTLSVAIAVSLVVSLTTTPMMCAMLLRPHGTTRQGRLAAAGERAFDFILRVYGRGLDWVLRHQPLTLAVTLLTMAGTAALYVVVPKGFFPQQDTGRMNGSLVADQDASFQATNKKLSALVATVMKDPAIESAAGFIGGSSNTGRVFVGLKPTSERTATPDQVIARLRGKLSGVPGATLYLQAVQDVRVGGRFGAAQYQYTLQGDDPDELSSWAPRVYAKLRSLPMLADVNTDQQNKGLRASLTIDRATASRLGITTQRIDDTLYDAFGQRQVSTMYTQLNQYHVVMQVDEKLWQNPDGLKSIYIPSTDGGLVPLSAIARFGSGTAPLTVNHQGQFPAITISFNLPVGVALGTAITAIKRAESEIGLPSSIRGSFQGTAKEFQASLANEPILILAALLAVYVVLGILYESLIHPVTILSTLPSAGVGALLALLATNTELSVIALIGIILLIGIVKKNAILMIDFAIEAERSQGKSPEEAIRQACLLRFRPITMTTMAALLGGLPLAIGGGTGSELRRPLGIAIVGGLIFSQMLTLFTTPVVYLYLDRFRLAWGRLRGKAVLRPALFAVLALLLTACAVGPDYKRPPAPTPDAYKELPPGAQTLRPARPEDSHARGPWWEVYGDPELSTLEAQVDVSSQTIAQAEAEYRGARAAARLAHAGLYPTISTNPSVIRSKGVSRSTLTASSSPTTFYEVPVDFSWEADLFGRLRRTAEEGAAQAQASAADLEGVRLAMHAELAVDYFELRGLDAEAKLFDTTVDAYNVALELTKNRYAQGVASGVDVAQAETQLESTHAQATDLRLQRTQLEHAIAVLMGKPPSEFSLPPGQPLAEPPGVPVGLPSDLLEQRPDVAAAERRAAAANAAIGVAQAAYFPSLTLSASGGFASSALGDLFSLPSRFWSIGAAALETIFDGGRRRAAKNQAIAGYDASVAAYRESVLTALQQVEDNLAALRDLEVEASEQAKATAAAERALSLAQNRYKAGITSYLEVVVAQAVALGDERASVDLSVRRMVASVNLVQALGGGWNAEELRSGLQK
ncbi:MAG TPA: multidrug efflux RND transporter permease subunit [Candidatus Polarisedimenticolaceae bacterium]|nr:multidrug efflux RND transporter permease subunit [Candidatus Polarisedimenticolaceae bacterium]